MIDTSDASLAGDSVNSSFLSDSAAADKIGNLLGLVDDEETGPAQESAAPSEENEQGANEPPVRASEDDEDSRPVEETEPEAENGEPKIAHGNMRTRLRDGRELTVSELKKLVDEAGELRVRQQRYEAEESQRAIAAQRIQQQAQQFEQGIQAAIAIMQENMPPVPDRRLLTTDPIEFITQKENYEAAKAKLTGLVNQQQAARLHAQQQMLAQSQQQRFVHESQLKAFIADQQSANGLIKEWLHCFRIW